MSSLLLPLLLLLLVVADTSLGKQHFLAEPADKVATRGERVSVNTLLLVILVAPVFWECILVL